jgi:predicted ATPase
MRIAISGTHRTGKSTLLEELSALLPKYTIVDEPYHAMQEDGYEFSHPPSLEDFEAQLEHAMDSLSEGEEDVLFDRCPIDFLGYISAHEDADTFDFDEWLPRVRAAVRTLDLIVLVPVETRDRIARSASDEGDESRATVDEKLKEILLDDAFELGIEVLQVAGAPEKRVRTVMQSIHRGAQ